MEAREFLEKFRKMCNMYPTCEGCPLDGKPCGPILFDINKVVSIVESWHPRTNKDALLETYPRAILMDGGIPKACPKNLDSEYDCNKFSSCLKCREEYWNEAVE